MLARVREQIVRSHMISRGECVILSVSGGPDSVALLHAIAQLAPEWDLSLHVFHLDHGLRGEESAADARYVSALAEQLSVPATVTTLEPGELKRLPGSLQANARKRRYQELHALAAQLGATKVATGHTQDDQAETVLMRFLRGAGSKGLAGIPPVRSEGNLTLIRPLLQVSRQEIELYCAEHKLFPRLDASNTKTHYLRNRIRLQLLPTLATEYNPAIRANLAQLAAVLREEDDLLEQLAQEAFLRCLVGKPGEGAPDARTVILHGPRLLAEPLALSRRIVRLAARSLLGPEYDLGLDAVDRVLEAAAKTHGTHRVDLPAGLRLTVEYDLCNLEARQLAAPPFPAGDWVLPLQGEIEITDLGLTLQAEPLEPRATWPLADPMTAVFDLDRLPGPLGLRFRHPGDRIWPVGMDGSKKLQDILVDAKIPRDERDRVPLLTAGSEVVWVLGVRLDRRFLADPTTSKPLQIRIVQRPPI